MQALRTPLILALLMTALLAGCTSSNYTVGGLGMIPGGVYTPGSNINPLSPGMFTGAG